MRAERLIIVLESLAEFLPAFLRNVSEDDACWKPPSQNWSILEIVCHLLDEETGDFRQRIELTLHDPQREWPSINPEIWAVERQYGKRNFQESVRNLVGARQESVAWLRNLDQPNWFETYNHPHLGPIRAGDLLASWVAHDQLHIRQIAKRKYEMIGRDAGEFSTSYAGDWG